MEQKQALIRLGEIIAENFRHKYYDRTVELYEEYLALTTGVGTERYLQRFSSRESTAAFEERLRVTVDICKAVNKNLTHVFYRVTRSSGVKVAYDVDDSKRSDLENILENFGRWGLDGYMQKRFTDLVKVDPNGWVVVDFISTDGLNYAQPYPVEFYSPDVIDFEWILNDLQYLAVKQEMMRVNRDLMPEVVNDYTIYAAEGAVKFIARPDIQTAAPFNPAYNYQDGDLVGFNNRKEKDPENPTKERDVADVFELSIPLPYNLPYPPCVPVGYLTDELTRGNSFVTFFDNAIPFEKKLIKINSEADISACKHAFPQRIQFVKECPNGCEEEMGVWKKDGRVCPVCDGNGFIDAHRSGLDCIYLPMTDDSKDINLDNIVKYVAVPIETLQYQDERIQALIEMCKRVIYNTDIFSKQEISETATAKLLEMENMYDTLYTYAVHYAGVYEWLLDIIGKITAIEVEPQITVSKDFKLLTKGQLIDMLKAAMDAGAHPAILKAINDELAYSFFGDSDKYRRYVEADTLIPFNDKPFEMQMTTLAQLDKKDPYRIKFLFGSEAIKELENEHEDYYSFTYEKRSALFEAKIAAITALIPEALPPVFNFQPDDEEE